MYSNQTDKEKGKSENAIENHLHVFVLQKCQDNKNLSVMAAEAQFLLWTASNYLLSYK